MQKIHVKPEIQSWDVCFRDVRFYNPDSSYLIGGIQAGKEYCVAMGKMLPEGLVKSPAGKWALTESSKKTVYTLKGLRTFNEKYHSWQIEVHSLERKQVAEFTTNENLAQYLIKKLNVAGVGPTTLMGMAKNASAAGYALIDVLNARNKAALLAITPPRQLKKITPKLDEILEGWKILRPNADYISPLIGFGLNPAQASEAIAWLGDEVLLRVKTNPYDLMLGVTGVSWNTSDKIAKTLGLSWLNKTRLRAALSFGMEQATSTGNIGVDKATLIKSTMLLVNDTELVDGRRVYAQGAELIVSVQVLEAELHEMLEESKDDAKKSCGFADRLVQSNDAAGVLIIWYKPFLDMESRISRDLLNHHVPANTALVRLALNNADRYSLAPEQLQAVTTAFSSPVSILTGGPGCGKTHTLKTVMYLAQEAGLRVVLGAPTGKAAKRMSEVTGEKASTLHSLVGFGGRDGQPIKADVLIIDEMSMADVEIFSLVLRALEDVRGSCRLLLVGDVDQLPSVGAGQVLRDIINSHAFPLTRLTRIFRQGANSGIIDAAMAINSGKTPQTSLDGQFEVRYTDEPDKLIVQEMAMLLRKGMSAHDIQVLSPSHKGPAGCTVLNNVLQTLCNPELQRTNAIELPALIQDKSKIYPMDKVLNHKNNAALGIVNGDIGEVTWIDPKTRTATLTLHGSELEVNMPSAACMNLTLAYAITVHKSQGAESPIVFVALSDSAKFMLNRNLLYTAVTRGVKKVILFTTAGSLAYALRKGEPQEGSRKTSLCLRLTEAVAHKVRRKALHDSIPKHGEPRVPDKWMPKGGMPSPFYSTNPGERVVCAYESDLFADVPL